MYIKSVLAYLSLLVANCGRVVAIFFLLLPLRTSAMGTEWYLSETQVHEKAIISGPKRLEGRYSAVLRTKAVPDELLRFINNPAVIDPGAEKFKTLKQLRHLYAQQVILSQTVNAKSYRHQLLYISLYIKTEEDVKVRTALAGRSPVVKGRMMVYLHCADHIYEYQTNPEYSLGSHDWHRQSAYVYLRSGCSALSVGVLMEGYGSVYVDDIKIVEKGRYLAEGQSHAYPFSRVILASDEAADVQNFIEIVRQLANFPREEFVNLDFEQWRLFRDRP